MENVVVGNIVLVLAVRERSATELVVVGNVVPFLVVGEQTTTPRVVVALVVPRGVVVDVPVVDVFSEIPLPQDPNQDTAMQAEPLSVYMRSPALLSACTMPFCSAALPVLSRADTPRAV